MLGRLYHDGPGVPQDDAEGLKWLRLFAELLNAIGAR
jgi:TPR repeat protein